MKVAEELLEYYTDVVSHCYEPDGFRIAAGTSDGKISVIVRDSETEDAFLEMESDLPPGKSVMSLHWGRAGIFVGSKALLYLYKTDFTDIEDKPTEKFFPIKFEWAFDCHDVCTAPNDEQKVFVACDDCRIRIVDIETQNSVSECKDIGSIVEVVRANDEFVVSGGQDGKVHVFDAQFRSNKPVMSFTVAGNKTIGGLDVSSNSTWLAAASFGGPAIFSLKSGVQLTQIPVEVPKKIYSARFDNNNSILWGGGGGVIYKSDDYTKINQQLKTTYGRGKVSHVYSITGSLQNRLSVAGSTNGILISDNGVFWNSMVYI